MTRLQKLIICLAVGLALNFSARANVVSTNNPYSSIVARNVFNLNPPAAMSNVQPGEPPTKITANGIMSIFGQLQVLFKVTSAGQRGQKSSEHFYILGESQQQDDIQVTHIDEKSGLVIFNNHGSVQEITLANTDPPPAMSEPTTIPAVTIPKTYPPEFIRARTPDYLGGGPNAARDNKPFQNTTLEQRIVMIEAQRAYLKSKNDPAANLLPPTALTPAN